MTNIIVGCLLPSCVMLAAICSHVTNTMLITAMILSSICYISCAVYFGITGISLVSIVCYIFDFVARSVYHTSWHGSIWVAWNILAISTSITISLIFEDLYFSDMSNDQLKLNKKRHKIINYVKSLMNIIHNMLQQICFAYISLKLNVKSIVYKSKILNVSNKIDNIIGASDPLFEPMFSDIDNVCIDLANKMIKK